MSLLPDDPREHHLEETLQEEINTIDEQTDTDPAAPAIGDGYTKPARDSLKKSDREARGTFEIRHQKKRRDGLSQSPSDEAASIRSEPRPTTHPAPALA